MTRKKQIELFQRKYGLNFIIDPDIPFEHIPEPYRSRMFLPAKREKGDPVVIKWGMSDGGDRVVIMEN